MLFPLTTPVAVVLLVELTRQVAGESVMLPDSVLVKNRLGGVLGV